MILRDARGEYRAIVEPDGRVSIDGTAVSTTPLAPGEYRVGDIGHAWACAAGDVRWVFLDGEVYEIEVQPEGRRRRTAAAHPALAAPMPATVVRVEVSAGSTVRAGDTLVILEAMKMELPIRASTDGTVRAVHCKAGDLVQPGVPLIDLD